MATWESKARGKVPAEEAGYWEMAAGLTESRVEFPKAWRGVGGDEEWAGEYNDGYGGWLRIVEKGGKTWFTVEVVRDLGLTVQNYYRR